MSWEDYLKEIYYNPVNAGSFSGPDKLYRYVKKEGKYVISKYRIRKWLQRQEPYSLQRPLVRKFKRNMVITLGIDDQWDADLMDMTKFAKENDGYAYILVVIDIFSKYLWLRPTLDKRGESITTAFQAILKEGRQPTRIRTDKGQEFKSRTFNALLKRNNIEHLYAQNTEIKANYAERVIKTVKAKIYRYMTYKQSQRYVDRLEDFNTNYNSTFHRTIDMAPNKVNKSKETNLWWKMYWPKKPMIAGKRRQTRKPFKFKVGDRVRVTHIRNPFTREYDQKWSGELFIIADKRLRGGIPVYRLKDYMEEDIIGTFYQPELQKVDTREDDAFKIETILKTKGRGRNKQYLVKWLYWPSKFNSWIKADSIEK
ncbi:hypothetical protein FSP39_008318 [Pinctada imbricata]|uniref:Integrase catalytic domain-containing protein n=1 Tax=Pinctada imbricata TaxID=66713 RepID=A0AA88YBQ2_PINIB|nr:hypothetical protein FSP39_008318 [Pinctada imbricata]